MNTKSIFQRAVFTSITIALILTFTIGKVNNTNVLDLFDGVLNAEASSGNISPGHVCSTNQYQQFTDTSTANNILLTTALNTNVSFDLPMIQNSFSPSLQPTESINNLCIQSLPNFGSLYQGATLFNPSTPTNFYANFGHAFYPQAGSYRPPVGFVGLACFDYFVAYESPAILAFTANKPYHTNVAQMRIQVGGSTRTTCGQDTPQPSSITGKVFNDINRNGNQDSNEPDYNTTSNILPSATFAEIRNSSNNLLFTVPINSDGTYSQVVPSNTQYIFNMNQNSSVGYTEFNGAIHGNSPLFWVTSSVNNPTTIPNIGIYTIQPLTSIIRGKLFNDFNNVGYYDNISQNYNSTNNILPTGTTVTITDLANLNNTFTILMGLIIKMYLLCPLIQLRLTLLQIML
jgi:hypothetical protein